MGISKTGCSVTITKEDLRMQYLQGFKECAEMKNETEAEIRADARRKFAEWLKNRHKYLGLISTDELDFDLAIFEKEQE